MYSDDAIRESAVDAWRETSADLFQHVELRNVGPVRGRGLVARCEFTAEQVAFNDIPTVAMQHIFSQRLTPCCLVCLSMVGDLEAHLRQILSNSSRRLESFPQVASHPLLRHPWLQIGRPPLPCPSAGCSALFCGAACRDRAMTTGAHRVLCKELRDDRRRMERWAKFKAHARRHHENFLLAAQTYASVICRVVYQHVPVRVAMADVLMFKHPPWQLLGSNSCLGEANTNASQEIERRQLLLNESLELLIGTLYPAYNDPSFDLGVLFDANYYAELLGAFDCVNVKIEYRHPLSTCLSQAAGDSQHEMWPLVSLIRSTGLLAELQRTISCSADASELHDDEDESSDLLPPFFGIGLSRAIAFTNHSCDPTCEVDFNGNQVVIARVLRSISVGDELTVSYIDEELPLAQRQLQLRNDYGFSCSCDRCRVDAAVGLICRRSDCTAAEVDAAAVSELAGVTLTTAKRLLGESRNDFQTDILIGSPINRSRSRSRDRRHNRGKTEH